jgi:signal transduction histidine kinase/ActR/RegA family two-component response regulator
VTALRDAQELIIGYLLIGTDNTARKQIEREKERLAVNLQGVNTDLQVAISAAESANLAKSDFLSSMSHELRSPLNAILGFAQLLDSGPPPPTSGQKDCVDQILHAGWYLLELINEILDLALIESGKLSISTEPMALAEVLADCQAMVEPLAGKSGIVVGFAVPPQPLFVRADRTRAKQIFINLLSNAIKYNRIGGSVDVVCAAHGDNRIRVTVRDTGQGLAPDKLALLFQPFNRLGQESGIEEGTGIGLVVSKRLVELMGGAIGANSRVGVGSEFWVDLPGCAAPESAAHAALPAATEMAEPDGAQAQATVLCVEDNPANLLLVARLLARRPDLRLISAKDGRAGVELARSAQPDLVLMDINLPGISGLTALRMLQADTRTAHIPVLALSANAMPHDIEKGLAAGFFRYLTKPIRLDEFMQALDAALDRNSQALLTVEETP